MEDRKLVDPSVHSELEKFIAECFGQPLPEANVLAYLSRAAIEEANAESSQSKGRFAEILQMIFGGEDFDSNRARIDELLEHIRESGREESNGSAEADGKANARMHGISPVESPETPPRNQPNRSASEKNISPLSASPALSARSPPAAAFLASAMSSADVLSSFPVENKVNYFGSPSKGTFFQNPKKGKSISPDTIPCESEKPTSSSSKGVSLMSLDKISDEVSETFTTGVDSSNVVQNHARSSDTEAQDFSKSGLSNNASTEPTAGKDELGAFPPPLRGVNLKYNRSSSDIGLSSLGYTNSSMSSRHSLTSSLSFGRISLNPNAAEFVPTKDDEKSFSQKGTLPHNTNTNLMTDMNVSDTSGAVLNRSSSSNSNASDDEYRRYWRDQLPDELISFDEAANDIFLPEDASPFENNGLHNTVSKHLGRPAGPTIGPFDPNQGPPRMGPRPSFGSDMPMPLNMRPDLGPSMPISPGPHSGHPRGRSSIIDSPPRLQTQSRGHVPIPGPGPAAPWGGGPPLGALPPNMLHNGNILPPPLPPPQGMPVSPLSGPSNTLLGGPSRGGNNNGGSPMGYGQRNPGSVSPHISPTRGPMPAYSPQGPGPSRFGGPGFGIRDGIGSGGSPPRNFHGGYSRGMYPPMDLGPGLPPPFELPPGATPGMRDRPLPPFMGWNHPGDGFDGPMGDMHGDGRGLPPPPHMPPPLPHPAFMDDAPPDDSFPMRILSSEFPGYATESLADIFYANGADLERTMEMLTQLELQEDNGRPSSLRGVRHAPQGPPPAHSAMDYPSLQGMDMMGGMHQNPHQPNLDPILGNMRRMGLDEMGHFFPSRSGPGPGPRSGPDFASVLRKPGMGGGGGGPWPLERNGIEGRMRGGGPGPPMHGGPGGFSDGGRSSGGLDRMESFGPGRDLTRDMQRAPQPWLDTGDAVASLYSEMREEARDHARVRNAYFEQATQAYLAGNKGLAKELSAKGQWHNEQMKSAHAKAGESIFRSRNLASGYFGGGGGGPSSDDQSRVLDLHGLHVNEALPILKRELSALRIAAQTLSHRQQIYVCVGTGHHTRGRVPSRLPAAVERFLVEDEHLNFTETQPGMLRIII